MNTKHTYSFVVITAANMVMVTLLVTVLIGSTSIHAQEHPNTGYLYRIDSRGPDTIFAHGFIAPGTSLNLLAHIEAGSNQSGSQSNFISVTTDAHLAATYALRLSYESSVQTQSPTGPPIYVYRIRSSSDFYQASMSLINFYSAYSFRHRLPSALNVASRQAEWVTTSHILPELIQEVRAYVAPAGEDGQLLAGDLSDLIIDTTTVTVHTNPHFIATAPIINHGTYPYFEQTNTPQGVLVQQVNPSISRSLAATTHCHRQTENLPQLQQEMNSPLEANAILPSDSLGCIYVEKGGYYAYFLFEHN